LNDSLPPGKLTFIFLDARKGGDVGVRQPMGINTVATADNGVTIEDMATEESAMRVVQPTGKRGSLKWIQRLSELPSPLFEEALQESGALPNDTRYDWISPTRADDWAEYRDGAFLDRLKLSGLREDLASYWPRRGPQWDALGRAGDAVYLIEAKAHRAELVSNCQAGPESRAKIGRALESARAAFGATATADWLTGYYQYANRLAHLHWLRQRGIDARLVFLYFTGDQDMKGPETSGDWVQATEAVMRTLGIGEKRVDSVFSVFLDCAKL
jgi:hypothetical protein